MENNMISVKSRTLGRNVNIIAYLAPDGNKIITHSSLTSIYWDQMTEDERPKITWAFQDMRLFPMMPPTFCVIMKITQNGKEYETIGEMTYDEWYYASPIVKRNPIQITYNRAFDKAFIRYLKIELPVDGMRRLYSDQEISTNDAKLITSRMLESADEIREKAASVGDPASTATPPSQPAYPQAMVKTEKRKTPIASPASNATAVQTAPQVSRPVPPAVRSTANAVQTPSPSPVLQAIPAPSVMKKQEPMEKKSMASVPQQPMPNVPFAGVWNQAQMQMPQNGTTQNMRSAQPDITQSNGPLPWLNGGSPSVTSAAPTQSQVPSYVADNPLTVERVDHDPASGTDIIYASDGSYRYDPMRSIWTKDGNPVDAEKAGKLFQLASDFLRMDLRMYTGMVM